MAATRVPHIDAGKIARVILYEKGIDQSPCPRAQDIVPVSYVVKVNSVTLDSSRDGGQEVEEELALIGRAAKRIPRTLPAERK